MPATTVFLLIGAFLLSVALAAFQYFFMAKGRWSQNAIFATLRFIALFSLLVLLINPKITNTEYTTEKPNLVLAVDNSSSIANFEAEDEVRDLVNNLAEDPDLREKFAIQTFSFGREVNQNNEFDFEESQSDLPSVFKDFSTVFEGQIAPVILITDGNQTVGEEFTFAAQRFRQPVIPVVVGDTVKYQDLYISRVNVNKYAFLNNRFPVEVMVNYSGNSSAESTLLIFSGESVVYSKALKFSPEENSAVIQAELPANSIGPRTYRVELQPLESEKNVLNNRREFAVEVIDERTKVLIAYSFLHPDVGGLKKAIESNQQREVEIKPISEVSDLQDYQLLILYQPDNRFKDLFSELEAQSKNYFLIAGPRTDWNFLNNSQDIFTQEITNQPEEFFPAWNENFKAFQTEDIGYSGFPPLEGNFGNIEFSEGIDILLYRQIQGVETNDPLLAIAEAGGSKKAFLMGANLWRWRSAVFQERNSFEDFDRVIGNLAQFLAAGSRKERLVIHHEPLYNSSEEVILQADFFDRNYNFDPRASLEISLMNEATGDKRQVPFLLKENSYEVDLSSLEAGVYNFTVNVSGEGLSRSGTFRIMDFDVEQQFAGANFEALQEVAESKGQKVYFLNDFEAIKDQLLSDNSYATVQKSQQKDVPLIDWKYLLGIIILALSAEWFLRKYYGLI